MKKILISIIFVLSVFNFMPDYAMAAEAGCTPTGPYNTITGKLCPVGPVVVCPYGDVYSTLTGKLCTTWVGGGTAINSNSNLPLVIKTSRTLPDTRFGSNYSAKLVASGATGSYDWTLFSGALPAGLTIKQQGSQVCVQTPCIINPHAVISGKPNRSGKYEFSLKVVSGKQQASKDFSIEVTNR
ncbi:MAG: putative Ig domain-containing protein [bacterium]|nr:putative Ig domain-containing protein [bacterium]